MSDICFTSPIQFITVPDLVSSIMLVKLFSLSIFNPDETESRIPFGNSFIEDLDLTRPLTLYPLFELKNLKIALPSMPEASKCIP